MKTRRLCGLMVAFAGAALSAGCGGQGKYTGAFAEEAKENANAVRSATAWDSANQAYVAGELMLALESVNQSIALKDDVAKAHLLRARILIEMDDAEAALDAIETGLAIEPMHELYYYKGFQLERLRRTEEANRSYAQAFALDPASLNYLLATSETYVELGRTEQARELLSRNLDRFNASAGIHQSLGHIALIEGDPETAATHFREASVLSPDSPSINEDLARVNIALGRFAQAEYTLARLLENEYASDRRDLKHMRARTLLQLDRPVEARDILRDLTRDRRGESDETAWALMIDVALLLNDNRLLDTASEKLMRIAPERPDGYLARAIFLHRSGRSAESLLALDTFEGLSDADRLTVERLEDVIRHEMARIGDAR